MTYVTLKDVILATLKEGAADANMMDATHCSQEEADHLLDMAADHDLIDYGISPRYGWVDLDIIQSIRPNEVA